jgi:Asp-tRNA(Asn)/Glu-tRNA(Gln) amidotransferase C subunit
MVNRKTSLRIRKTHRYLGIFLGLQFLMWTISGLYFSWTDIDEIHGDHFKKESEPSVFEDLNALSNLNEKVYALELKEIAGEPYYWVNESKLIHARSGAYKPGISEEEALAIAHQHMKDELIVSEVHLIDETDAHHEYRGRDLPAYVISYTSDDKVTAYVSVKDGSFQTVRHRDWRWFDFLWMTHTMDYETRDDFNTTVLRAFSLLGLITVCSGFLLWGVSSPTVRKLFN